MSAGLFYDQTVYVIGIGGIGMSAVAALLHSAGARVQGSDSVSSDITESLVSDGILVHIGHSASNISGADFIVRSSAISDDNIEIQAAKSLNIPILHRAEALAALLNKHQVVSITGTHGKSTTTALVGHICAVGQLDPTIVNGAIINEYKSNVLIGQSALAIIEADESDGSFLRLPSIIGCVTNMDPEHLDYYGTAAKMEESYASFISAAASNRLCFTCQDHSKLALLAAQMPNQDNIISYGLASEADIHGFNLNAAGAFMKFDVKIDNKFARIVQICVIEGVELSLRGTHNVQNALAAIGVALSLGVPVQQIKIGLKTFQGLKRRFTQVGTIKGATIIDDYAHHPVEIRATLAAAKQQARATHGRVIAVLQPHRYTRLAALMQEFSNSFIDADIILLTQVYAANEAPIAGATSEALAHCISASGQEVAAICSDAQDLKRNLLAIVQPNDIVVVMGAGDSSRWAYSLAENS